jgi:fatty acyl-CoA reductase
MQKLSHNCIPFHTVITAWKEPFPGWVDNFNGPVGLMVAGSKGHIRTMFADPNTTADFFPVDVCIQFMLLAAWFKGVGR